jgi:ribosomal protein L16 Arg81 hydroxylase
MTTHAGPEQQDIALDSAFRDHLQHREPVVFRHALPSHPALDIEAIAELADALGAESVVREDADRPLVFADGAPEPAHLANAGDVLRALDENGSWMTLLNIEKQPRYRQFIDATLDRLAEQAGLRPAAFRRRMGFVFASSPNSVTGAHFDVEHSLLLQLRGNRVLSFGEFPDAETRDAEVRRYWHGSYGKLTSMPVPTHEVSVGPGDGVYIPPFRPHWLHNGPASSLSLTLTFFTKENETETYVQAFNERLRALRLRPRREGESPTRDRLKATIMRGYGALRGHR